MGVFNAPKELKTMEYISIETGIRPEVPIFVIGFIIGFFSCLLILFWPYKKSKENEKDENKQK